MVVAVVLLLVIALLFGVGIVSSAAGSCGSRLSWR